MGFSRQESWSGLPFPTPGDLPEPGIEPTCLALAGRFFTTEQYFSFKNGWNKTQDGITRHVVVYGQHLDKCIEAKGDGHTPKITANRDSNKNFSMNVHRSTIHNSPKVEIIWMSINRWMNKTWPMHIMKLFNHKTLMKHWYMLLYTWTSKTWCYGKEAGHKRPHIVWFYVYEMFRIGKSKETKQTGHC